MAQERLTELGTALRQKMSDLDGRGLLPNGASQLVTGAYYRRDTEIYKQLAQKGIYRGSSSYDEEWNRLAEEYNLFSGPNLAAVALYQHNRYSPEDERFPSADGQEYVDLEVKMGEAGSLIAEFLQIADYKALGEVLTNLDSMS